MKKRGAWGAGLKKGRRKPEVIDVTPERVIIRDEDLTRIEEPRSPTRAERAIGVDAALEDLRQKLLKAAGGRSLMKVGVELLVFGAKVVVSKYSSKKVKR